MKTNTLYPRMSLQAKGKTLHLILKSGRDLILTYTNGYYVYLKISVIWLCPPTPCDLPMFKLTITFALCFRMAKAPRWGEAETRSQNARWEFGDTLLQAPYFGDATHPLLWLFTLNPKTYILCPNNLDFRFGVWNLGMYVCTTLYPKRLLELRNFNDCNNLNFTLILSNYPPQK